MVDSDADWREAGGLSLLQLQPAAPDAVTMQIPIIPGDDVPWVEPRRVGADGPVWDATDEMYITYDDKDGHRVLITTGERDIWNREHSYQRTGSAKYEALRGLADSVAGLGRRIVGRSGNPSAGSEAGERPQGLAGPRWAGDPAGEHPTVHPDRDRHNAGYGSGDRAHSYHRHSGGGVDASARLPRYRPVGRGVSERSDERRVRSHRHCPGCSGHRETNRAVWELTLRALAAWAVGWFGLVLGGVDVGFARYCILTSFAFLAAVLWRPVWRELTNHEDRQAKGGRR